METTKKLPLYVKFLYGLVEFGFIALVIACNTYLMIYLTNIIGLSALVAPVAMAGGRFLAAFTGPLEGIIIERSNFKAGKYRVWFMIGMAMFIFATLILFSKVGLALPKSILPIFVVIIYWLWGIGTDMTYIPFLMFNSILTLNLQERVKLSSWRVMFNGICKILTGFTLLPLMYFFAGVKQYTAKGMFLGVFSFAILFMICTLGLFIITKPYKDSGITQIKGKAVKVPVKDQLKLLVSSKELIGIFIAEIWRNLFLIGIGALLPYFFTYVVKNTSMLSVYMGSTGIILFIGSFLTPFFTKRFSKKACYVGGSIFAAICYILMYFNANQAVLIVCFGCAAYFGVVLPTTVISSIYGDVSEYIHWRTNKNARATINSLYMVSIKIGATISYLCLGAGLAAIGFKAGTVMSAQTIDGLRFMACLVPAILLLLSAAFMVLYKVNEKEIPRIQKEIAEREAAQNLSNN